VGGGAAARQQAGPRPPATSTVSTPAIEAIVSVTGKVLPIEVVTLSPSTEAYRNR
jgi:hypothetical protein